tara:strand:- start:24383 stop:25234 length:852 start_codon:yes stop_codon:yes gene_type:complete
MPTETINNQDKNKLHYEKLYSGFSINNTLYWITHLNQFLPAVTSTETSWFGMYMFNFQDRLKGKKILEMGCGDCTNAAVMAALGAEVYANDIASSSGEIVKKLNLNYKFDYPITFIEGDFLHNKLPSNYFDFVVGKAFLHHLTILVEQHFLKETARLLKQNGEARFFEPAINNRFLDEIRWYVPVTGRPSKFNKSLFEEWKKNDPHPDRSFSSQHFENAGMELFKEVSTHPVGAMERLHRILPKNSFNKKYRQWALKNEKYIPRNINRSIARSQLIIYKVPKQ